MLRFLNPIGRTTIAPMTTECDQLVPLRGFSPVPWSVVLTMTDMESRGVRVRLDAAGALRLGPRAAVTAADLAFAREHKPLVMDLVRYIDRLCKEPL
jgi:hypothetical protein